VRVLLRILVAAVSVTVSYAQEPASEGTVVLELVVSPEGKVTEAHVVSSDLPAEFNDVAVAKAREGRFRPRQLNGKPVETRGSYTMKFKLSPEVAPELPAQPSAPADFPAAASRRPGRA
jgi:TonB family protein